MKIKFPLLFFFLFLTVATYAQEKGDVYYSGHKNEILPDADAMFRKGNYDRALQLCDLHKDLLGLEHAEADKVEELRARILECQKLAMDMEGYLERGNDVLARAFADELRKLNPTDERLKQLSANKSQTSQEPKTQKETTASKEQVAPKTDVPKEQSEARQPEPQKETKDQKDNGESTVSRENQPSREPIDYSDYYTSTSDFEQAMVVSLLASGFGIGNNSFAPGFGAAFGLYNMGNSRFGAEIKGCFSPWIASSYATLISGQACAVIGLAEWFYINAGIGYYTCRPSQDKSSTQIGGFCVPGGLSFVLGDFVVLQVGASYYPSVYYAVMGNKTVSTNGKTYSFPTKEINLASDFAPYISIGLAF